MGPFVLTGLTGSFPADRFGALYQGNSAASASRPFTRAAAVTLSDTVDLPFVSRALYVGGAGDIVLWPVDSVGTVTLKAVPVGTMLNIRVRRVSATLTTATNLVALD